AEPSRRVRDTERAQRARWDHRLDQKPVRGQKGRDIDGSGRSSATESTLTMNAGTCHETISVSGAEQDVVKHHLAVPRFRKEPLDAPGVPGVIGIKEGYPLPFSNCDRGVPGRTWPQVARVPHQPDARISQACDDVRSRVHGEVV